MEKILLLILISSEIFLLSSCLLTRQYYYVGQPLNWTEAQTYCRQKHTDLATIGNSEEMNELMTTVSSAGYSSVFWIGLYSNINWTWSDGFTGSLDYAYGYWSSEDFLNSRSNQICMVAYWYYYQYYPYYQYYQYYQWSELSCSSLFPFVCYNGTQQNPVYVFVNERMNWSSAQRYCRQNFTDLVTVRYNTDWTKLYSVTPNGQNIWTGLYRDSNIYWSDGKNVSFPTNSMYLLIWLGRTSARCGYQNMQVTNHWYFDPCENRYPFVCYGPPKAQIHKRVVKLRLKTDNSSILNDPAGREKLLKKLQDKLEENGVSGVTLKWRETSDGKVFNLEGKKKKP